MEPELVESQPFGRSGPDSEFLISKNWTKIPPFFLVKILNTGNKSLYFETRPFD
jgi:hypothetical protein